MAFRARSFDIFLFSPLDLDQPSPPEGKTTSLFLLNSVVIGFRLVLATCSVWRRREEKVSGEREREGKRRMKWKRAASERAKLQPLLATTLSLSLSLAHRRLPFQPPKRSKKNRTRKPSREEVAAEIARLKLITRAAPRRSDSASVAAPPPPTAAAARTASAAAAAANEKPASAPRQQQRKATAATAAPPPPPPPPLAARKSDAAAATATAATARRRSARAASTAASRRR